MAQTLPLTTKTIIAVGSYYKGFYRNYGELVLVVEGKQPGAWGLEDSHIPVFWLLLNRPGRHMPATQNLSVESEVRQGIQHRIA